MTEQWLDDFDTFSFSDEFKSELHSILVHSGCYDKYIRLIVKQFMNLRELGHDFCQANCKDFNMIKGPYDYRLSYIKIKNKPLNIRILYYYDEDIDSYYYILTSFQEKEKSDYKHNINMGISRLKHMLAEEKEKKEGVHNENI